MSPGDSVDVVRPEPGRERLRGGVHPGEGMGPDLGGGVRAAGEAGGMLPRVLQLPDALFGEVMPW